MKMKKVFVVLLFTAFYLISGSIFAQGTVKLGHINSSAVFAAMPESDSAQKTIERERVAMRKTLEELQVELNKKYEDYLKLTQDKTTSQLILSTKEEEMNTLQQRIQNFQQDAEQTLSTRGTELFKPIQEKAIKAVNDVAAENGYTYIFDTAGGAVVYTSPDSQDILPLVKAKLGLK
jgi:outer membrane protein